MSSPSPSPSPSATKIDKSSSAVHRSPPFSTGIALSPPPRANATGISSPTPLTPAVSYDAINQLQKATTTRTTTEDLNASFSRHAIHFDNDDDPPPLTPAIYYDASNQLQKSTDDLEAFLRHDLDVSRLNRVHAHLWLAGRPMSARPLHRQVMMGRSIVVTEQADLHLTWTEARIFVKPLPAYLLQRDFWEAHLCDSDDLHASALGFLLSYVWLVGYESDWQLAATRHPSLLPPGVTWPRWTRFLDDLLAHTDLTGPHLESVNMRYHYGELRLARLNKIYRLAPQFRFQHLVRGYYNQYNQYQVFFRRNFAWLIIIFAYFTIVLTAMQLGLATERLSQDASFQSASYGFAVFSVMAPVIAMGLIVVLFLLLVLYNLVITLVYLKSQERKGRELKLKGNP